MCVRVVVVVVVVGEVPGEAYEFILLLQRCYSVREKSEGCLRLLCAGLRSLWGSSTCLVLHYCAVRRKSEGCLRLCVQV